jgi:hypothetical protein
MIEIDHDALNNQDPSPPEPAKPILASQLLELEKKHRKRFTEQGRDERISTECGEIDEILGGGFERGIVVGISAEGGEGRFVGAFSKLSYFRKSSEGCWRQNDQVIQGFSRIGPMATRYPLLESCSHILHCFLLL